MADDVASVRDSAMRLRLTAERLAVGMELATLERQQALLHYPRLRRLLNRCLCRAASGQAKAGYFSAELHRQRGRLLALQQQVEVLDFFQAEGVEGIKADLGQVEQIIRTMSTAPEAGEPAPRVDGEEDGGAPGSPSVSMKAKP